jgi:Hemerythrin HHE cation binding domain
MPAASRFALRPRSGHEPEPDLTRIVVTHRAICQDLDRLVAGLGRPAEHGLRRSVSAWRYMAAVLVQIRVHNEGEDDILWPVVAAAAGPAVDLMPLAEDRLVVTATLTRVAEALAGVRAQPGAAGEVFASVRELRDLLAEHIADEEQQVLPAMRRYLRADACRWCEQQIQRKVPLTARRFAGPWLARYAQPDELRGLRPACGWPGRLVLTGSGAAFARLERRALTAGLAG